MPRLKKKVALVFGESDNDRSALIELIKAINTKTDGIQFQKRPKPLVLLKPSERRETRRGAAEEVLALVKASNIISDVKFVVTHRDCDAIEPAHDRLTQSIEAELSAVGVENVIAATPAFEMETWWMLFPNEVSQTRQCWRRINYGRRNVGLIENAKEDLKEKLRPAGVGERARCPEFVESDGVQIARNIRKNGAVSRPRLATSDSFDKFVDRINRLKL